MKRLVGCVVFSFAVSLSALAAPKPRPFDWNLYGSYALQLSNVHQRSWGQDFPCTYTDQNNMTHTVTVHAGSSLTFTTIDIGGIFFDGHGLFHAVFTEDHQFDQAASDATVSVQFGASCNTTNVDNGHAVFTIQKISKDGSYSISASGIGGIDVGGAKGGSLFFIVGGGPAAECTNGGVITAFPNIMLIHGVTDVEAPVGTAIFNGTTIICP
jgi:hypothetical protein